MTPAQKERLFVVAFTILIVVMTLVTGWLYGKTLFLESDNRQLRAIVASYKPQPPAKVSDAQCVAWLFKTNLKAARDRVCGNREKGYVR